MRTKLEHKVNTLNTTEAKMLSITKTALEAVAFSALMMLILALPTLA